VQPASSTRIFALVTSCGHWRKRSARTPAISGPCGSGRVVAQLSYVKAALRFQAYFAGVAAISSMKIFKPPTGQPISTAQLTG
jgi:hypothetical protein